MKDVVVIPATGDVKVREPADRSWTTLEELAADDDHEPDTYVEDRDPLTYLYTSGTTSFPKGVVGSHLAIYLESMSTALENGWTADDRFAAMMPMFHSTPRSSTRSALPQ